MGESAQLTAGDRPPAARIARLFASPAAVLILLPALVIAAGVVVLLLGRRATRDTAETMARHQLVAQAEAVRADVAFALDQADPVLSMMKSLADAAMPTPDAMGRMRDIGLKRPGVTNISISFPIGVVWGSYVDRKTKEIGIFESRVGESETTRTNYGVKDGQVVKLGTIVDNYDPRTRDHYKIAVQAKKRVWMPPRVLSSSGKTALTVSEPVYGSDGELSAVLTIDFEVANLSEFISNSPLEDARNVMFTSDGTILAYPAVTIPDDAASREHRLLRHEDFNDPALEALFKKIGNTIPTEQRFFHLDASDGKYLAAISSIGSNRANSATPVDWYLATLVPERRLFGSTQRLGRDAIIASGAALAIAMGFSLMFAWNILRMRRAVGAAREQARSAEARAKQLGSYKLVARLGAGGMGEVWRAEHQLLARKAAIKLVRPDVLRANMQHATLIQERFRREAQTLASMRSRHTIELYDYGVTDEGTFFYVMELLDGLDLSQLVKEYGPQPAARVISIIGQACQSLGEAHTAGLLHRDIKPANLVLCRAADEVDIVKVLDFGIVHSVTEPIDPAVTGPTMKAQGKDSSGERLTTEGSVIGTPGYIPPEQAVAAPLDSRGDLYALGCVAWYLLVGEEVYPGLSEDEVLRAHVYNPIPSLRAKMREWLPVELEQLIVKCLAKSPEQRPEDARALAKALSAIEIPQEHQWTDTHAQMWWSSMELPKQTSSSDAETVPNDGRVLVPNRAATQAPGSGTDARTIEARPSVRTL